MSYILRDRPDGMVEIMMSRPVLVGIFPDSEVAAKVYAFLSAEEPELPEDQPACFATTAADVAAAADDTEDMIRKAVTAVRSRSSSQLPTVVEEKPRMAPQLRPNPVELSDDDKARAFARILDGQKIHAVAADFGVSMSQLRRMWANHRRYMQEYMAEGGPQPCAHCQKPFTPSLSNPETCARCSK